MALRRRAKAIQHFVEQKRVWVPGAALGIVLGSFASGLLAAAAARGSLGSSAFWRIVAQPLATLGTGLLAVVAATFALAGVLLTQRTHVNTTKAQLRQQRAAMIRQERQHRAQLDQQLKAMAAQQSQHEAQLSAQAEVERKKHRREATFEALRSTVSSVISVRDACIAIDRAIDEDLTVPASLREASKNLVRDPAAPPELGLHEKEAARACESARARLTADSALLLLLDMEDSYKAVMKFNNAVGTRLNQSPSAKTTETELHMIAATFTTAIGSLRGKYDQI